MVEVQTDEQAREGEAERAFRERVRRFLDANVQRAGAGVGGGERAPAGLTGIEEVERAKRYQAALFDAELAGLTWPRRYGGQELGAAYQTIFNEELADFAAPVGIFVIGFGMCMPTLLAHGAEDLKQRYVPAAARGAEIWCQMFSEPGAGSDVASLQTRAVLKGGSWVVNGQKVWTSGAHYSDFGILLARTNPDVPKHNGLSMFILEMHAPGVTVRPLRQMTGGANFNEVFFNDVRIPADRVVGDVDDGWRVAITTLMNERVSIGTGRSTQQVPSPLDPIAPHVALARARGLAADTLVRQDLSELVIRSRALSFIGLRIRAAIAAGKAPGPEGSTAKLAGSTLALRSAAVGAAVAGVAAVAWDPGTSGAASWSQSVLSAPSAGIAGGTNEIMRNIIGDRVLGLPKEPQFDRGVPFRELIVGTQPAQA